MQGNVLSVERVIPVAPDKIFALLADAARHRDIDGSGTVVEAPGGSQRLGPGSVFGMSMRIGVPYSMVNTVIEYDENRRIAWQAAPAGFTSRFAGGRIWRYELEAVPGGTRVRESWDVSQDKQRPLLKLVAAGPTKRNMEKTLERIEALTTGS